LIPSGFEIFACNGRGESTDFRFAEDLLSAGVPNEKAGIALDSSFFTGVELTPKENDGFVVVSFSDLAILELTPNEKFGFFDCGSSVFSGIPKENAGFVASEPPKPAANENPEVSLAALAVLRLKLDFCYLESDLVEGEVTPNENPEDFS
jgi:hypothetical protein